MIIGHDKNLDFLEKAVKNGNLANVYCFCGVEELGKKTTAEYIAAKLLSTTPEKLSVHPDFLAIAREKDEKTEKTKKDVSIEQVVRAVSFLKNKSWLGGNKVVIVDEAQFLNASSANAFLKILEEPGENSFIFLITDDEKKIPKTILSRSQILFFSLVGSVEIEKYLQEKIGEKNKIDEISYWSWGRPGRAVKLLNNEDFLNFLKEEKSRWQRMLGQSFYERLKESESWFGPADGDHIQSRNKLVDILEIWQVLWRELLYSDQKEINSVVVLAVLENLRKAKELLVKNIHPRLVVEKIFLTF